MLAKQSEKIRAQEMIIKEQGKELKKQDRFLEAAIRHIMLPKWKTIKIIQLVPELLYGDAVGNDVIALHNYLLSKGYDAEVYAEIIDSKLENDRISNCSAFPDLLPDDILLYHFATFSDTMGNILCNSKCRKIMIYHNITPSQYFEEYNPVAAKVVDEGREQLRELKGVFECCLADSKYNKQDLRNEGYTCPIAVLPVLISYDDFRKPPDETIINRYRGDGITNIIFVGRIVPNKKQEDVIAAFSYYHIHINPRSRLFIVGSEASGKTYYAWLKEYVQEQRIEEAVIFTGHIPFTQILAYYHLADVFLCMSEHEGFCVPLIEAMLFSVPIIAYGAAAVPETIGDAGIIVDTKDPATIAGVVDCVVNDEALRKSLYYRMQRRLNDFSYQTTTEKLEKYLSAILECRLINK